MSPRTARIEGDPPNPVSFRTEVFKAGTVFPRKRQAWGELNYALSGVCEFEIDGARYLSPPHYGIWIPPGVPHEAWNRHDIRYVCVYVERRLCKNLPSTPCTLGLSLLLKAILADFDEREVTLPATREDLRLAQVLVDQIRLAPRFESYLPMPEDALLVSILHRLQADPGNRISAARLAGEAGTTERTLSRRCQEQLGMSFNEWRQRLKLVSALALLDEGEPVFRIAQRLGYGNASAFITMFRRMTGTSPMQARRREGRM
ncbi:MAG TPA: helix-turn-helix transcriptional regulator [Bordetella sp.]